MKDHTKAVIEEVEEAILMTEGIISPHGIAEIFGLLVNAAETIVEGGGVEKHLAVRDAFAELDREYGIVDMIDDALRLPFWAEPFDGKIIRASIDLMIGVAVAGMNAALKAQVNMDSRLRGNDGEGLRDDKATDRKSVPPIQEGMTDDG